MIELDPTLAQPLRGVAFDQLLTCKGSVHREVKSRRTVEFELGGKCYFIKIHQGCGWGEVWKNWLKGQHPVTSARPEWEAIARLEQLGIPTLKVVGRGIRGKGPAKLESFVITEALDGMVSLEELTQNWEGLSPGHRTRLKRALLRQVAAIARTIHRNGMNHRDFYLCHFLVRDRDWTRWQPADPLVLHLIDLHRMQIRPFVPRRWLLKDLAGLLFSAMDSRLTKNDLFRFAAIYWDCRARDALRENRDMIRKTLRRARSLYSSFHGRLAPEIFGQQPGK